MILWPPGYLSSDKSSLSVSAFKGSDWNYYIKKIKIPQEQKKVKSELVAWQHVTGIFGGFDQEAMQGHATISLVAFKLFV
ncbi:MAG: hypothetical protein AAF620_18860 [Bacteroidota bacterium]